jgi:hypothetical protein
VGVLALAGLAAALLGASTSPVPVPSGDVVGEGTIDGVDYQIRSDGAGLLQGWVMFDGRWSMLDEARGDSLELVRAEIKKFIRWLHTGDQNPSVNQLQGRLDDAGIQHFDAKELLRIRHPGIAAPLGFEGSTFEAGAGVQAQLVAVAALGDQLRTRYGGQVTVLNGYRPRVYNDAVSEASGSQHVQGRALDLTASDLPRLRAVAHTMYLEGRIRGLGLYKGNVHIDTRTGSPHLWGSEAAEA